MIGQTCRDFREAAIRRSGEASFVIANERRVATVLLVPVSQFWHESISPINIAGPLTGARRYWLAYTLR